MTETMRRVQEHDLKPDHLHYELRTWTNNELDHLVEKGANFRKFSIALMQKYLAEMQEGRWCWDTGETLAFTHDLRLLDGQHRLAAAASYQRETGQRCWWWCAIGVSDRASHYMNTGKSRNLGDYLRNHGVPNPGTVGAIVRLDSVMSMGGTLEDGVRTYVTRYLDPEGRTQAFNKRPSMSFMIDRFIRFRGDFERWGKVGAKVRDKQISSSGLLASLGYQFAKQSPTVAEKFFHSVATGINLKESDPIYLLRRRLLPLWNSNEKMTKPHMAAITIKAWKAWAESREMNHLSWRATGPKPEPFPDHVAEILDIAF